MTSPTFAGGGWSIHAVDVDTGDLVFEYRPNTPLVPGATQKLYTAGAALDVLGADTRVETTVHVLGEVTDGILDGNLALVGGGDDFADLAPDDPLGGLRDLADQVAARGITEVRGEVIVDNRLFATHTDWTGGRVDSIWINGNKLDVVLTPSTPGSPPDMTVVPELDTVTVHNDAVTVDDEGDAGDVLTVGTEGDARITDLGGGEFLVSGEIGADAGESTLSATIDEPVGFARSAFIEVLRDAGITVRDAAGDLDAAENPADRLPERGAYDSEPLAVRPSATTAERLESIFASDHHRGADLLACLLAVDAGSTDCDDGIERITEVIEDAGIPSASVTLVDGAGRVDHNRTTAKAQVDFLLHALDQEWGEHLLAALPTPWADPSPDIRAVTGTRIVGYPAIDAMFYAAQSYAGHMTTASGRTLAFSVIFNSTITESVDDAPDIMDDLGDIVLALHDHA